MPPADAAFISLATLADPSRHQAYNEWHHLDHRPENLALDGVRWGERWVLTPECQDLALVRRAPFDAFHYLTLYWFRPPVQASIAEWADLADRSFHWGRRPELPWTSRPAMGFYRPVLGYAAPRVEVSPAVVPLRPNRGVYVTVTSVTGDPTRRADVEQRFRWYDRTGIPALVDRPGVAGAWTFSADDTLAPEAWARREQRVATDGDALLRVTVLFLDDDPTAVADDLAPADLTAHPDDDVEQVVFAGPLEAIEPWRYDWFDEPDA